MEKEKKESKPKTKSFFKSLGLFVLYLFLTLIFFFTFGYLLVEVAGLHQTMIFGSLYLLVAYFWGGYFLSKTGYKKIIGIILYTIGVMYNFFALASSYVSQQEYRASRIFILFGLAAGIFLMSRPFLVSKILGVIVIILTILATLLSAFFLWTKPLRE